MKIGFRMGAGLLGLAAAAVAVFLGSHMLDARARDRFLREGAGAAPLHVTDFGPLPPQLRESSGLAISRAHPGVFWSNNDSGDEPRIYALDTTGALLAAVNVRGAHALDWEALDIGPCPDGPEPPVPWCLYVADTGNNAGSRRTVNVYVVPEPDPHAAQGFVLALGAVHLTYPDTPFDAEALAVTQAGDLIVVTKGGWSGATLYTVPAAGVRRAVSGGDTLRLAHAVALPMQAGFPLRRVVMGGGLSGDGTVLAVGTYSELYFFAWPPADSIVEAAPPCFLGGLRPQGESVAVLPDGRILLSSESPGGVSGRLLAVECAGVGT